MWVECAAHVRGHEWTFVVQFTRAFGVSTGISFIIFSKGAFLVLESRGSGCFAAGWRRI